MFTHFTKNIFTKKIRNIAKPEGYDKGALLHSFFFGVLGGYTSSYLIYKFLERDRVTWKVAALKKNDDDPSWYMDGGVEDQRTGDGYK